MDNKNWFQVIVSSTPETVDALCNFLFDLGSVGIVEQDQFIHSYFPSTVDRTVLEEKVLSYIQSLKDMGFTTSDSELTISEFADKDWNSEWKKHYAPLRITDHILVKPTWCKLPEDAPPVVVEIDPEMAFGTGTHATTSLCITLLDNSVKNKVLLDAGTGTGILAITAAKLGARWICGFDIDPIASHTAKKNAEQNGVTKSCDFFAGQISGICFTGFDIIVANINRNQIIEILPFFRELLIPGGRLVLSGILDSEEQIIKAGLLKNNFKTEKIIARDEWLAFDCLKN
ncbi:50S ribosomal protein L11 methyltransferase [candidate division KSB1 bacterium]|nr:50S ribosomal protein L11 methyltransferase [candidate division KSB1 bacterium]